MEPAVTTVLAEAFSQPTACGDFGDWRVLPGFKANQKPVSQAGGVRHSRRNFWLTQAPGLTNFSEQNTVVLKLTALMLLSTFVVKRSCADP